MVAKLIATDGPAEGTELLLEGQNEWNIGRDAEQSDLTFDDPNASRKHVLCRLTPQGYMVENLNLTNPILLNDEVLEELQLLQEGDTLKIGETEFSFSLIEDEDDEEEDDDEYEEEDEDEFDDEETEFDPDVEEAESELSHVAFELNSGSRWVLKVITGPNTGAEFNIDPDQSYLLGTDPSSCDIVFQDISVSRQHARITIRNEEELLIEDLGSRNGVFVDGHRIEEEIPLHASNVFTVGTTSLLVYDKEAEAGTVIPPAFPGGMFTAAKEAEEDNDEEETVEDTPDEPTSTSSSSATLVLLVIITTLFALMGYGVSSLFKAEEVVVERIDYSGDLERALREYPSVKWSFNDGSKRLLLLGHLSTKTDRSQLLYDLQSLDFIRTIDDNIIIDEFIWQESNQILGKNPDWQGVTIHSPGPGRFVVAGFLKTRQQLESLIAHLNINFPYIELLERRILVEESIVTQVDTRLQDKSLFDVTVKLNNGELSLGGTVAFDQVDELGELLNEFKDYEGIKSLKNFVVEIAAEESMINITPQYEVTGWSHYGETSLNVVINGRILSRGDTIDGMTITSIRPNAIFLEKDGFKYRIDYND